MWDDQQQQQQMQGQMMQDPNAPMQMQQPPVPMYDPYQMEQIRQEVELAHEEFQRLLAGRPRLYSQFR